VGKKRILELNAPGGIQVKRREHEERGSSKKARKAPGRRGEGDEVGETTCGGKDSSEEERSTKKTAPTKGVNKKRDPPKSRSEGGGGGQGETRKWGVDGRGQQMGNAGTPTHRT